MDIQQALNTISLAFEEGRKTVQRGLQRNNFKCGHTESVIPIKRNLDLPFQRQGKKAARSFGERALPFPSSMKKTDYPHHTPIR